MSIKKRALNVLALVVGIAALMAMSTQSATEKTPYAIIGTFLLFAWTIWSACVKIAIVFGKENTSAASISIVLWMVTLCVAMMAGASETGPAPTWNTTMTLVSLFFFGWPVV